MKMASYNVICYMNSEGITLRVLKPTFLPFTKHILNYQNVLKINRKCWLLKQTRKKTTVLCFLQHMCSRSWL